MLFDMERISLSVSLVKIIPLLYTNNLQLCFNYRKVFIRKTFDCLKKKLKLLNNYNFR